VSYDLVFWNQDVGVSEPPETIYKQLMAGDRVAGLADLNLEGFLAASVDRFPDAVRERNGDTEWIDCSPSDGKLSFQVEWSVQHVAVFCQRTSNEEMNRLIDIAVAQECRLYDPQVNERFA
jgi:hypothetical protein